MRRFGLWTIALVLVLVLSSAANAATPPAGTVQKKKTWFSWLWPFKKAGTAAQSVPAKLDKSSQNVEAETRPGETPAARQAREKADLVRRFAVCNKLEEIAIINNDDELRRRAEQLNDRAWTMYLNRTGQSGVIGRGLPVGDGDFERPVRMNLQAEQSRLQPGIRARGVGQASSREE